MDTKSVLREYLESFGIAVVLASFIILFIGQSHVVDGASMEPTLHNRERIMVDKLTYKFSEPQRGEIVVFRYPSDPRRRFVKRIMGLPGDQVEVRHHQVYVNEKLLDEPYINGPTYGDFGPVIVPEGHYFVMGDNRNNSEDSRFADVGPVPRKLLVGRALFRFWPVTNISLMHLPAD